MTANDRPAVRTAALQSGCLAYLTNPVLGEVAEGLAQESSGGARLKRPLARHSELPRERFSPMGVKRTSSGRRRMSPFDPTTDIGPDRLLFLTRGPGAEGQALDIGQGVLLEANASA